MPLIHHPVLQRELEVSETSVAIWCQSPRPGWLLGPLPVADDPVDEPTAKPTPPVPGTNPIPSEEE